MNVPHGLRSAWIVSLSTLIYVSCDLPNQFGPQPTTIIDAEFEPGLNILGVLRLDDTTGTSFIHVERAYTVEEYVEGFSPVVRDAEVWVTGVTDANAYLFTFQEDSVRGDHYLNPDFTPIQGEEYHLRIAASNLPELTASTTIPLKPSIDLTSLIVSTRLLSFDLVSTSDTNLYDLFLVCEHEVLSQRIVNERNGRIPVSFNLLESHGTPLRIEIYGYDTNLAEYATASITIKPQTYQQTLTTVTSGYGCFGSVARTVVKMPSF